jgi:phosphatidylserine decarboxylase
MIKFHREGAASIFIVTCLLVALNFGLYYFLPDLEWFNNIIIFLSIIFLIMILQFFRNPERFTPVHEKHVISPADGKVVVIEEIEETEYFKDRRIQVSIFMSPVNVHVNRNPISGFVRYSKYHPGKYLVAWHPKSSTDNERTSIVIENPAIGKTIMMKQIAGALARRIVNYSREGQGVWQGKEFGFIKFGSRVDVILPLGTKINVKLQEVVRGGETVIAEFVD